MNIFYIEKYYTLDKIPEYRRQFIDSRIAWLIEALDLKASDWPLDSIKLIGKIVDKGIIPLHYGFFDLTGKVDGVTDYNEEHDVYLMQINKSKIKKSLKNLLVGRPNLTIWHEIGHSVLEHNLIPNNLKTEEEKAIEELEAYEFAGRMLMPKWLLYSCNFRPASKVAEYLLVSEAALWIRLNNMKSLITLKSKRVPTCTKCGNTVFSASAKYCGICGQSVSCGLNGIRRVNYSDDSVMIRAKKETLCPKCIHHSKGRTSYSCIICFKDVYNYCTGHLEQAPDRCTHFCFSNHRYCEICGRPTYFYEMKFLKPWQEVYDIPEIGGYSRYY